MVSLGLAVQLGAAVAADQQAGVLVLGRRCSALVALAADAHGQLQPVPRLAVKDCWPGSRVLRAEVLAKPGVADASERVPDCHREPRLTVRRADLLVVQPVGDVMT